MDRNLIKKLVQTLCANGFSKYERVMIYHYLDIEDLDVPRGYDKVLDEYVDFVSATNDDDDDEKDLSDEDDYDIDPNML